MSDDGHTEEAEELGIVPVDSEGRELEPWESPDDLPQDMAELAWRAMTDRRVDVDKMDRLMEITERERSNRARRAYTAALAAVRAEDIDIVKDKTADYPAGEGRMRYTYASIENVIRAVNPVLSLHGFSHQWRTEQRSEERKVLRESRQGQVTEHTITVDVVHVTCILTHKDGHAETESFTAFAEENRRLSHAQRIGAAMTYGQRRTILSILGIAPAEDDDDARRYRDEEEAPPPRQRQQRRGGGQRRQQGGAGGSGRQRAARGVTDKDLLEQLQAQLDARNVTGDQVVAWVRQAHGDDTADNDRRRNAWLAFKARESSPDELADEIRAHANPPQPPADPMDEFGAECAAQGLEWDDVRIAVAAEGQDPDDAQAVRDYVMMLLEEEGEDMGAVVARIAEELQTAPTGGPPSEGGEQGELA